MALLEQILVLGAHRHDRAHVDLVVGREHRGGVLRVLQPPRDGLAQPRHLHAFFARGVVGGRGRAHLHGGCGLRNGCRRRRGALDRRHHVALGDAAVLAGPFDLGGVRSGFGGDLAYRRRERRIRRGDLGRRRRSGCRSGLGFGLCLGGRFCGSGFRGRARTLLDAAEQRADRDRLAVLRRDIAERARSGRRHLDRHLVGFELDQRLVDRDRVTRLLEPFADGGLGDGFAERGDADFSHDRVPFLLPLRRHRPA